jgi:ribA/ribD-fused uncharacterized protein
MANSLRGESYLQLDPPELFFTGRGDRVFTFQGRGHAFSNLSPTRVKFMGQTFPSTEHGLVYFLHLNAGDAEGAERVLHIENMKKLREMARDCRRHNPEAAAAWGTTPDERLGGVLTLEEATLKELVRAKFIQHPTLLRWLLATGDAYLVEATRDRVWGGGFYPNEIRQWTDLLAWFHTGNLFGHILMELREEFRLGADLIRCPFMRFVFLPLCLSRFHSAQTLL